VSFLRFTIDEGKEVNPVYLKLLEEEEEEEEEKH